MQIRMQFRVADCRSQIEGPSNLKNLAAPSIAESKDPLLEANGWIVPLAEVLHTVKGAPTSWPLIDIVEHSN